MQYILSEVEYNKLKSTNQELNRKQRNLVQDACTMACNNTPVLYWNNTEPKIWGCILTTNAMGYCDECPVIDACPHPNKEWSK